MAQRPVDWTSTLVIVHRIAACARDSPALRPG